MTTVHTVKSKGKILHNFVAFSEYMNFTKSYFDFSSVPTVFGNQQTEYVNIIKEMLMASLTYQASYDVRFCAVKGKKKYNFLLIIIVFT